MAVRGMPAGMAATFPGFDDEGGIVSAPDHEHARLVSLVEAAEPELDGAHPLDVLRWAADEFGDRLCITSSMADAVLSHLASRARPGIHVVFLDTGYHFAETIGTRDAVASTMPVTVLSVKPSQTVAEQDAEYGPRLYERDPDLCCAMRKVRPLEAALSGYHAWGSGVRRDEAPSRANTPVVAWDAKRSMVKINPLATWTQEDVDAYATEHGVLINPLIDAGYTSVGCAPCTRAVKPGEDARAGRWAGRDKVECGLHI